MFLLFLLLLSASAAEEEGSGRGVRRYYELEAVSSVAPLVKSLPSNTSIYNQWPPSHLKTELPDYLSVAAIYKGRKGSVYDPSSFNSPLIAPALIGPAIHVQVGDVLQAELINRLPATGLSLHWHGFEMTNALAYDGVAGVTQCPLSPGHTFVYKFRVDETPGTYWYHTHSGHLGLSSYNAIRGPLIVHPAGSETKAMVDSLNHDGAATTSPEQGTLDADHNDDGRTRTWSPFSYHDERILFLSDGFLSSDSHNYWMEVGGLLAPASRNDDGFVLGTSPWEFGTVNGKLREVISVQPGKIYKFRLINGGQFYAFRFSIDKGDVDSFPLTVVATDSEPVKPYNVDEVILHAAERMDVLVTVPQNVHVGSSFWIRADTLESSQQGYQNGIRAILNIVSTEEGDNVFSATGEEDYHPYIRDPAQPIESSKTLIQERRTLNCYSQFEKEHAKKDGGCFPITELVYNGRNTNEGMDGFPSSSNIKSEGAEFHTVDFVFQGTPQHSHFVRIDEGRFVQHVNPRIPMLSPEFDPAEHLHPHTSILNVEANSTVIIVWRSRSQVDHPIHLHGLKMEILQLVAADRERDCTMAKCKLSEELLSSEARSRLENTPFHRAPLKDTFVLPAGGTAAVRIRTGQPAVWFGHCHIHTHLEDGMAFVLNVGNFINDSSLRKTDSHGSGTSIIPNDYPSCDTPFLLTQEQYPACQCYVNENAVLGTTLSENHYCSRRHLCFYKQAPIATLESYTNDVGVEIRSDFPFPSWVLSVCLVAIITVCGMSCASFGCFISLSKRLLPVEGSRRQESSLITAAPSILSRQNKYLHLGSQTVDEETEQEVSFTGNFDGGDSEYGRSDDTECNQDVVPTGKWKQFKTLAVSDWKEYRPTCVNYLRLLEVTGLAAITGLLFFDVGTNNSSTGLGEKTSLLFFSTTLWTFTRMYPAVGSYYSWKKRALKLLHEGQYSMAPLCVSRLSVVVAAESIWPFIYTLVSFPLASLAGDVTVLFKIALLLCLNNLCYISIGSVLGSTAKNIPLGMIASTITSQASLVAAGCYTTLPPFIEVIRLLSPVFWTFSGIVKSVYRWSDTYDCVRGQSDAGPTQQCYIETNPIIDNLKTRSINVATFGDERSNNTTNQFLMLALLYMLMQMGVALSVVITFWYQQRWRERFALLEKYKMEHGTCRVPRDHVVTTFPLKDEEDVGSRSRGLDFQGLRISWGRKKREDTFALGRWVERQRRILSHHRLPAEHVVMLDSIGFRSCPLTSAGGSTRTLMTDLEYEA